MNIIARLEYKLTYYDSAGHRFNHYTTRTPHLDSCRVTDKMKCSLFQAVVMSILLYGCTTWMLTKHMEKKFDSNYTRILLTIWNKCWRQHPTKQQLYGHLPLIMKWCNGYRHRIWTRWYEFNSWTRLITFHIALIPLGKVWIQLFSLQLWVNSRAD